MTRRMTVGQARKARKPVLTQEELAEMVGVDQTYVSLIEAGKRQPSNDIKERLAKALGIAPSKLRFTEPEPSDTVVAGADRVGHSRARTA